MKKSVCVLLCVFAVGCSNDEPTREATAAEVQRISTALSLDPTQLSDFVIDTGPVAVPTAGITLECKSKSYHITTGGSSGRCMTGSYKTDSGETIKYAQCNGDDGNNRATASCKSGCVGTSQGGDCTVKNSQ